MPRYFFNMVEGDGNNLVRDSEGTVLSGVREARKEAVGLARDLARHGLDGLAQTWRVVVSDERGDEVLTVPLSKISTIRVRALLALGDRFAKLRAAFAPHLFASVVAITTVAVLAIVGDHGGSEPGGSYQVAAAPTEGAIVAVRFAPQASVAEITAFLDAYQASVVGGPGPGGLFRLRVSDDRVTPEQLAAITGRMTQETVVAFAAAVQ